VSDRASLQLVSFRNRDAALSEAARNSGSFVDAFNDSAGLLHNEAQCQCRDAARDLAGVLARSSLRPAASNAWLPGTVSAIGKLAIRNHRVCREFLAAQRRFAGGICGVAGDP